MMCNTGTHVAYVSQCACECMRVSQNAGSYKPMTLPLPLSAPADTPEPSPEPTVLPTAPSAFPTELCASAGNKCSGSEYNGICCGDEYECFYKTANYGQCRTSCPSGTGWLCDTSAPTPGGRTNAEQRTHTQDICAHAYATHIHTNARPILRAHYRRTFSFTDPGTITGPNDPGTFCLPFSIGCAHTQPDLFLC